MKLSREEMKHIYDHLKQNRILEDSFRGWSKGDLKAFKIRHLNLLNLFGKYDGE